MTGKPATSVGARRASKLTLQDTIGTFARYWLAERKVVAWILGLLLAIIAAEATTPIMLGELAAVVSDLAAPGRSVAGDPWWPLVAAGITMSLAIILRQ
ncbi:MAG: hypothetical protein KJ872_12785, partial [Alphaproteobacteria bacterium]|nr:hypothetical protein [Alphaproteobacteria bacterium]